ncbi:MAG TPA: 2-oxoglutarate dehydrogenase E1 component, partial [Mizugakiibacter sp.]
MRALSSFCGDSVNLLQAFSESSQLGGGNAAYIEALYETWLRAPDAVPAEWRSYFDAFKGRQAGDLPHSDAIARIEAAQRLNHRAVALPVGDAHAQKQAGVLRLLTAFRSRGHLAADLDPLGLAQKLPAPDLELAFHGLGNADLDTEFDTGTYAGGTRLKLRELVARLKATYTATIGAEFMHISDAEQRRWIYTRLEQANGNAGLGKDEQLRVLERLTAAEGLERYLHTKYVGQKRFSLEGGDSLIPMLDEVVRRGGGSVKDLVIGMAHRGRLNVLVNTLGKPPHKLFDEFEGKFEHPADPAHSGDVKYHMGFSADVRTPGGTVHLALAFNPSHLEIVDPVVVGSVRARQTRRHDEAQEQVQSVLIHGDAAFTGQGVVTELFNMSQARGFAVGGTLHIVINNQVGFTISDPRDARSAQYCTDVAKMVNAPVFHVNGDDPEAVLLVTRLAYDFRRTFKKDVVIDLVCYRRHGHNEADEPAATQPLMYQVIRARSTTRDLYAKRLAEKGVIAADDAQKLIDAYRNKLEAGEPVTELDRDAKDAFAVDWTPYVGARLDEAAATGVDRKTMAGLLDTILDVGAVKLHPRVAKIYDDRHKMAAGTLPIDWGFAENLAYAALIKDGYGLRLVGQDSGRGTFFHRHAVLHDQASDQTVLPLARVRSDVPVAVIDSV